MTRPAHVAWRAPSAALDRFYMLDLAHVVVQVESFIHGADVMSGKGWAPVHAHAPTGNLKLQLPVEQDEEEVESRQFEVTATFHTVRRKMRRSLGVCCK